MSQTGTQSLKRGLAEMLKGGVIMDVTNAEQAKIAEAAGACAVMALERVPADIRKQGGVARMTDPKIIKEIQEAVSIPVMAKVRIGHFAEAQILESLEVDFIDESEVLTPADKNAHIDKHQFKIPFVCGARNLPEALRRIQEGASMIRTKGEAGTGNVANAVEHMKSIHAQIKMLTYYTREAKMEWAEHNGIRTELLEETLAMKRLPVVNFAAGGLATPADVSLLMQLGADGVFVGSGVFKSSNPQKRAEAMAVSTTHFKNPEILARVSEDLGDAMVGIDCDKEVDFHRWATITDS